MFNHLLSIAAFGFIAFIVAFVHPAPPPSRAAAQQADVASKIAAAHVSAAKGPPRLAGTE